MYLKDYIKDVPDFPKPGITFKDIGSLMSDKDAFYEALEGIDSIANKIKRDKGADYVAGIDARGFIFAAPIADRIFSGFVPIRKKGKLPGKCIGVNYGLEYGHGILELQKNVISQGEKVLIIDDVLATGGTAKAAAKLVEQAGGIVVGFIFLVELGQLGGRNTLQGYEVYSLLEY